MATLTVREARHRRHRRVRGKVAGTAERPRLVVSRSNRGIVAQLVDDSNATTIASASWLQVAKSFKGNKTAQAGEVGKLLAQKAKDAKIQTVVFDRGGYLYHGRVKALADAAREGGLKF
ncbi:MAG: 50S ribosomal protein L18 [Gaiellaceae bacterium]